MSRDLINTETPKRTDGRPQLAMQIVSDDDLDWVVADVIGSDTGKVYTRDPVTLATVETYYNLPDDEWTRNWDGPESRKRAALDDKEWAPVLEKYELCFSVCGGELDFVLKRVHPGVYVLAMVDTYTFRR